MRRPEQSLLTSDEIRRAIFVGYEGSMNLWTCCIEGANRHLRPTWRPM
jgi:hypothetical protein